MPGSTHAVSSTCSSRLPGVTNMPTQRTTSPAHLLPAFENERLHSLQQQHPPNMCQSSPYSPHRSGRSSNRPRAVSAASVTNAPDYRVWSEGLNIIDYNHAGDQSLGPYGPPPPPSSPPDLDDSASVFSLGAYCRDDNACTPRIDDHAPPDDVVISIPSTPRVEQLNSGDTLSLSTHLSKSTTITTLGAILRPESPSNIRRSRRPAPLNLEHVHRSPTCSPIVQGLAGGSDGVTCVPSDRRDRERPRIPRKAPDVLPKVTPPVVPEVEHVKGIDLQLCIDQEEYRMIRPVFRFKKHSQRPKQRPPSAGVGDRFTSNIGELGLVELRMASRDVGTFHVGKTSSEACIRRVIVNNDDTADYLSQIVMLPLSENGIYTVNGLEKHRGKKTAARLVWRFEYSVEDRRMPQTGHLVSGEKLLRPLSFVCSPELLSREQAMRVTIKQILTKRLSPTITALKIPPPTLPIPIPTPVSATSSSSFTSSGNTSEFSFQTCETSDSSVVSPKSLSRKHSFTRAVRSLSRPPTPKVLGTRSRPQTPSNESVVRLSSSADGHAADWRPGSGKSTGTRNRSSSTTSRAVSIGRKSKVVGAILNRRIDPECGVLFEGSCRADTASPIGRKGRTRGTGSFVGQAPSITLPVPVYPHHDPNIVASRYSGYLPGEEIPSENSAAVTRLSEAPLSEEMIHTAWKEVEHFISTHQTRQKQLAARYKTMPILEPPDWPSRDQLVDSYLPTVAIGSMRPRPMTMVTTNTGGMIKGGTISRRRPATESGRTRRPGTASNSTRQAFP